MTLDQIAIKCGTDKSSLSHAYTQYYEMFLSQFRDSPIKMLEIGIDSGNSIRMWQEYFPKAEIHGIDIRGDYEYLHDGRTYTHIVDQSDINDLLQFGSEYDQYFNLVCVDGSHVAEDDILTFNTLFSYLKPGGLFICEDENCSADTSRWGRNANFYDRVHKMINEVNMNNKFSVNHLCANKKQEASKYDLNVFERDIEWVFNSMSLVIVKKMDYSNG
jgi:trans-aconitate methyltransferase